MVCRAFAFPREAKKKISTTDQPINLKYGSSRVLGLGHSSSACTRMFLEHEIEEESSIDLGLSIELKVEDNRSYSSKKAFIETFNASKTREPILDLQLSLSAGPADSDLTTVSQRFFVNQIYSESPALMFILKLVDERSTSSRWKTCPLIPQMQNVEISIPFNQEHDRGKPNQTPSLGNSSYDMVNQQSLRNTKLKACSFEGCTKGAVYYSWRWKEMSESWLSDYCVGHDGGRRCSHEGCTRAARGKSGLCIRHGDGKRCKIENFQRSAEGIAGLCISYGGGRRCQYPQCSKGAQGSMMFCKANGGGRRCTFLGCQKSAERSTTLCKSHGGGKRCTLKDVQRACMGELCFALAMVGARDVPFQNVQKVQGENGLL